MTPEQQKVETLNPGQPAYNIDPYINFLNGHSIADDLVKMALVDVQKSGLKPETINNAGVTIFNGNSDNLKKLLGRASLNGQHILSLCRLVEIPYHTENRDVFLYRYKLIPSLTDKDGREVKYLHPTGKPAIPYILPAVWGVKDKLNKPVWITEGEKKALALLQYERCCIALPGVWNFKAGADSEYKNDKDLWAELKSFHWMWRIVYFAFDNDLWTNPQVRCALYELAFKLYDRQAIVKIVSWQGEKGIDDYLTQQDDPDNALQELEKAAMSLTAFLNPDHRGEILRAIPLLKNKIGREIIKKEFAKKCDVPLKTIQEALDDEDNKVISANFPGLIDLVVTESGDVEYLIKEDDSLRVETAWEIDDIEYTPPGKAHLPFQLPKAEAVLQWYESDSDHILFQDIIAYLKQFSFLEDRYWLIVCCKVFLTYLQDHPDIHYLPMILFYAVPERGKSRTGKAIIYISFRGIHIVDMRETNLFRYSQNLRATLFLDLMNLWEKAEKNGAEDILLLRYEKGAKVARVIYPEKGAFKDTVYYDIYGPTLMATNGAVHKILDTRCITISMPNKPGEYNNPTPEKAKELKERLTAWRARMLNMPLPKIEAVKGINGRLWDISKPLLQVCKLVYPQGLKELEMVLLEVAGQRIEDKRDSIEWHIINHLYELSPKDIPEWNIRTANLLEKLNGSRPEGHKLSPQYIGKKLKAMDIPTHTVNGRSEIMLNSSSFNTLLTQYGFENISLPTPEKTLLNPTTRSQQGKSRGCQVGSEVGIQENPTENHTYETRMNAGLVGLVGSGREFTEIEGDDLPILEVD